MAAPLLAAAPAVAKFIAANGTRAAIRKFGQQAVTRAKNQMAKASSKIDDALTPSKLKKSQATARSRLTEKQQKRTKARETAEARENPTNPATRLAQRESAKAERAAAEKATKRQASRQKTARKKAVTQRKRAIAKGAGAAGAAGAVGAGAAARSKAAKTKSENEMRAASKARRSRTPSRTAVGGGARTPSRATSTIAKAREMGRQAAATPKPKRPMKPQTPPKTKIDMPPADSRGKVTGKGGRNVGQGAFTRANVTKEQLKSSGMTLRQYLNFMDREGKRPPKKAMGGGMMKSKMGTKGGAMGGRKRMPPGYGSGGMAKKGPKGYAKGGAMTTKMKPKGFKKGGKFPDLTGDGKVTKKDILKGRGVPGFKKGGKPPKGYKRGGKVRGAGIARKGVRPAKMF
tara:strand:- start:738 stop:1943 length:1206 start_codon:yes stop_codon:yes gene_type:complete